MLNDHHSGQVLKKFLFNPNHDNDSENDNSNYMQQFQSHWTLNKPKYISKA